MNLKHYRIRRLGKYQQNWFQAKTTNHPNDHQDFFAFCFFKLRSDSTDCSTNLWANILFKPGFNST